MSMVCSLGMLIKIVVCTNCKRTETAICDLSIVFQGSFQQMWISKQEYEEGGKSVVDKKCP